MKLQINATIIDDDGSEIVTESLCYEGNKSGVIHAVKPVCEALIYSISLGLFYLKQIPVKDALWNFRTISKDVVELNEAKTVAATAEKKV